VRTDNHWRRAGWVIEAIVVTLHDGGGATVAMHTESQQYWQMARTYVSRVAAKRLFFMDYF
jgi:hypothetical protein